MVSGLVLGLGWRKLENRKETQHLDHVYSQRYQAEEVEKNNLISALRADLDERAALVESHRSRLTTRHVDGQPLGAQPVTAGSSDTTTTNEDPALDATLAVKHAGTTVNVLIEADGTPRIVESSGPSGGRAEVTRYYLDERGKLMLAVRTDEDRVNLSDRWYFVGGEFVDFAVRVVTGEAPPTGWQSANRHLDDTEHFEDLHNELRAALVRVGLDAKAAHIVIPATVANNWTFTEFPPALHPTEPDAAPLLPRTDATPAISRDADKDVFDYTQSVEMRLLTKVEKELDKHDDTSDPAMAGYFDGEKLVKVEHRHSTETAVRNVHLYYREGRLVAVDAYEYPTAKLGDGILTAIYDHFAIVDRRIATYWLEEGGVRAMFPTRQRVQEIEAQALADDAAARSLFDLRT